MFSQYVYYHLFLCVTLRKKIGSITKQEKEVSVLKELMHLDSFVMIKFLLHYPDMLNLLPPFYITPDILQYLPESDAKRVFVEHKKRWDKVLIITTTWAPDRVMEW